METSVYPGETLDEKKKMVWQRKNLIRVFYPHQACLIYKHILMGLHEIKAHNVIRRFLHSAQGRQ
jgi:hypothetical protein